MSATCARSFEHGASECLTEHPLFSFCKGQVELLSDSNPFTPRGLALAELEFLTRYGRAGTWCLYAHATPYLPLLAQLFPTVQFHAFDCEPDEETYDPGQPSIRCKDYGPNVQTSSAGIRRLAGHYECQGRGLLICHPTQSAADQRYLHKVLRPGFSFLSLADGVPDEYLSGDLYFPFYTPLSSGLIHIAVPGNACDRLYYPKHLKDELAHFQVLIRCGTEYDSIAEAHVIQRYTRGHEAVSEYIRLGLPPP